MIRKDWIGAVRALRRDYRADKFNDARPHTSQLTRALDLMIVFLMVAILLTVSLPVCIAIVERNAIDQTRHVDVPPQPDAGIDANYMYAVRPLLRTGV